MTEIKLENINGLIKVLERIVTHADKAPNRGDIYHASLITLISVLKNLKTEVKND